MTILALKNKMYFLYTLVTDNFGHPWEVFEGNCARGNDLYLKKNSMYEPSCKIEFENECVDCWLLGKAKGILFRF